MLPKLDPFTVMMSLANGHLHPDLGTVERRLVDMAGMYLNEVDEHDRLIYRVFLMPVPEENSEIQCSTTILEPGTVGDEFHMTKGHFHRKRDRSEVYVGLAGTGMLVMATEDGRHAVEPIEPGAINYVPGGWAHRSVNSGDDRLVFFAAYVADAGHDYATIEKEGFPVVVVKGQDGPKVVPNDRYRS
ncbi:MAG: glucose-6-phosphate isomerase family protein [Acidimicrobiia bacterium]